MLFTDIVASTEQLAASGDDTWGRTLDQHDRTMERLVASHRGRIVNSTGDGTLAAFDGPARAVRCAAEMLDAARQQGITLRARLHTGEIETRPTGVVGIAVHTAKRIAALADAGEILVSRTVVDLTAGSGLQFAPRGEHQLKGRTGPVVCLCRSAERLSALRHELSGEPEGDLLGASLRGRGGGDA